MELAVDCLRELGEERQILLFTCQSREGRAMSGKAAVRHIRMA
jgi:hypothetical protein